MAAIFDTYEAIRDTLNSALAAAGAGFVDGYVMEGEQAPKQADGSPLAFATLIMGDTFEHFRGRGICGPENDLEVLDFLVVCSAPTNFQMVGIIDIVSKALIGYIPSDDTGPIRRIGGSISTPVGALLHPIMYNKGISFELTVGATTAS